MYDVHVRLIGKREVDFLLVLTELFLLGLMAEVLREKGMGQYPPNFHIQGDVPHQSFWHG